MRSPRLRAVGIAAMCLGAIGGSYLAMRSPRLESEERALAVRFRRPRGAAVDRVVSAATDLGSMFAVAGVSAILGSTGRRRAARDTLVASVLAWVVAQSMKAVVGRPRPYVAETADRLVSEPAGTSWPSGHPAVAASVAAVLAPQLRPGARAASWLVCAFVAGSRVYVGVHYPTDVIAGVGIGGACGAGWYLATGS